MALAALLATTVAAAQDRPRPERADCRCVDAEGEEIPDCTCLRTGGSGDFLRSFAFNHDARARLGITVSTEQGASLDTRGALVQSVTRDGPADDAGIEEGDVITRVDGHGLLDALDADTERDFDLDRSVPVQRLLAILRDVEPDQEVEVHYEREGETRTTTVEARELGAWTGFGAVGSGWRQGEMADRMRALGDRMRGFHFEGPEGSDALRLWADSTGSRGMRVLSSPDVGVYVFGGRRGLDLIELKPGLASYFGVDGGVLVAEVDEDSALGLEPGDVVLAVGDRDVEGPEHLRRILRSYQDDEPITFRIMRHEREMSVQGRLVP
jgi:hypothetical protein